jgi:aldehyde:ferredoxin oxidoreductase
MSDLTGWSGRILRVHLDTGICDNLDTRQYVPAAIGGRALGAALGWEMLRPGMDAFDPDAPLMFLVGPLAGTSAPAAGRTTICSLTPQGHPVPWFSRGSMGGDLGHHIKYAGYDGIVITGRAPRPVYLHIEDDEVELVDAGELWGQGIMVTQETLRNRLGARVQIAAIGPAGETLSRIATIGTNGGSAAGQGGLGAVMGAKNLKAVVVRGTGRPRLARPEAFRAMARGITQEYIEDTRRRPGRGPNRSAAYGARRNRCSTGCIMGCGTRYEGVQGTIHQDRAYDGVVQCTAGRFGGAEGHYWHLGFEAGFELNMAANDWGINHWDLMKGLFPWIGMCHRAGLLPDIGGRRVEPDSPVFWWEVLESIATRRGPMAEVVADGGWRAIQHTGLVPDEARELYTGWGYANHWDGRGPRGNQITYPFWLVSALLWMIETRDPMGSTHGYVQDMLRASPFGAQVLSWEQLQGIGERLYGQREAMNPLSDYEGKAEAAVWHARRSMLKDSLPLCDRIFPRLFTSLTDDGLPRVGDVQGPEFEYHLYALATGHEVGAEGLDVATERALALERAQQVRDFGRTRDMETPVLGFFCETLEENPNPLLGERRRAEPAALAALADEFYRLRGWDVRTGAPGAERLEELGLGYVAAANRTDGADAAS